MTLLPLEPLELYEPTPLAAIPEVGEPWLPMKTAPLDGTPVLLLHRPPSSLPKLEEGALYYGVTEYEMWADGFGTISVEQVVVGFYGGGYTDTDWESGHSEYMPDWWFAQVDDEIPLFPVGWMVAPVVPTKKED